MKMKLDIKKMIRPNCAKFEPYVAGKPVETIKRELGLKKVYKMASNENPLGPSKKAIAAVKNAASRVYFYPDSNSFALRQALAKANRIDPSCIMLGSGSDELIELIGKLFFQQSDEIVVSDYAFIRYRMAGELMGSRVVTVPMKGLTHDLAAMAAAVNSRTKAVFVTNPNNPTGTYNTRAEVERFLAAVDKRGGKCPPLIIMDEAYYEYACTSKDYPQTMKYLAKYPNLIILRTFSKAYGLAGMRVGYGFAAPEIVDYIERIRPPFNISLPSQAAAVAALDDAAHMRKSVALVEQQKKVLYAGFTKLGIPYVPTAGNFVLINVQPALGRDVFLNLLKRGLIVRAMDEYRLPNHVRITVGLPVENKLLLKELAAVLKK